ncbi:MAG: aldehyde ferredoxin oxidoreductase family protein [Thermoprotei archaeon]|nr:aldehyde ferredoxin oxidoreductase family protein [Thermoprotei archaeon]
MLSELYGYAGRILRVDLSKRSVKIEELDRKLIRGFLGGRGFNVKRLYDEVPKGVDPLSPENKLLFATGPIAGTGFPIGTRLNVTAKSPQTGLLGDSNVGGHFAAEMKYCGFDQIILEGKSDRPVYVYVHDGSVEFMDAQGLWGLTISEAYDAIRKELRDWRVQIALIGPAAENYVKFAGIFFNLHRPAARTGLGAVMASKNVKALVVRGDGYVEVAEPDEFEEFVREVEEAVYSHEQYWPRRVMGTSRILMAANRLGFLPADHFTKSVVDYAYQVSGERLAVEYNVKNRSCFSCILPCSRFYVIKRGKFAGLYGEGPEYEPLAGFTVRIGNRDLDAALKAISMVNDLGMDAITTSEVISWAMELYERGLLDEGETGGLKLKWGDMDTVFELIDMIAYRRGFGDLLADGVAKAAKKLGKGAEIALHVKGLELIQADPRGLKGYGLGFAVASRGADHLRSEPFIELSDDPRIGQLLFGEAEATMRLGVRGKGKLVAYYENWCAVVDSLEVCKNIAENMEILPFDKMAKLIEIVVGMKTCASDMMRIGERIVNIERAYIVRQGVRRRDDVLPRRFLKEPIAEGPSMGHVIELEVMLDEYYKERGWDPQTGIPTAEKLHELGLHEVVEDLRRNGVELRPALD